VNALSYLMSVHQLRNFVTIILNARLFTQEQKSANPSKVRTVYKPK